MNKPYNPYFHQRNENILTITAAGAVLQLILPFEPSCVMQSVEPVIKEVDDTIIIGYLADDRDCQNPNDDEEDWARICQRGRRGTSDDNAAIQRALGLDRDDEPNYAKLNEEELPKLVIAKIEADPDLREEAEEYFHANYPQPSRDKEPWQATLDLDDVESIMNLDSLQIEMWREYRESGAIGNRFAVMLDIYEHGGISYSVAGRGMSCRFDTTQSGAMWIPGPSAIQEIKRQGRIFQKGDIVKVGNIWTLQTNDGALYEGFVDKYNAMEFLDKLQVEKLTDLRKAESHAGTEMAASAAEYFTAWANGQCFITIIATYSKEGEFIESSECWGFIGQDNAMESLTCEML